MDFDDDDAELIPDIQRFAMANGVKCFTSLVVQLENNGLTDWAECAQRTSVFWTAYFEKWTRNGCEGCERTNLEFLSGLDWSV